MVRVTKTRQVESDLLKIWLEIALHDPAAADRQFDRLEERCAALVSHPRLGQLRPDIARGARCLVEQPYLILYRIHRAEAEIVRIVHGARDLRRIRVTRPYRRLA